MIIEYHPALERELQDIRNFYESKTKGLGAAFVDEFEKLVRKISSNPGRWMVIEADIRRALMKRFPYVVYFRQASQDRVRITVVKHQRRHPSAGRERK
jgi:toxin ParE1/3/4